MVARLDLDSVSLAQNPKSATSTLVQKLLIISDELTDFNVTTGIEQNIVTLDITMDNALCMKMLETATSLPKS